MSKRRAAIRDSAGDCAVAYIAAGMMAALAGDDARAIRRQRPVATQVVAEM